MTSTDGPRTSPVAGPESRPGSAEVADSAEIAEAAGPRPPLPDRFLPVRYGVFLGVLAALAFALVQARAVTYGPALTNDSIHYQFVADRLLAGEGFTTWDAREVLRPYVEFPPFYPIFLAAARLFGLDLFAGAHLLNAALFALAVLAIGRYAARHLRSGFLRVWTPAAVALSLPFARFAWHGLSDALFTLLTLLVLLRLCDFLEEGKRSSLAWAAVFAGLAFATRYVGVVVTAWAGLLVLLRPGRPARENFRNAAGFTAVAGLPMAAWLVRNYFVSGTWTGRFPAPDYHPLEIWRDIGSVVLSWARFDTGSVPLLALSGLVPLAALLFSPRLRSPGGAGDSSPSGRASRTSVFGGYALLFGGFYFVAIALELSSSGVEARHLFPARLPLVVALATALDPLLEARSGKRRVARVGAVAPAALLAVWAAGQIGLQREAIARANSAETLLDNGRYGEPWVSSETRHFLRTDPSMRSGIVYTNRFPFIMVEIGGPWHVRNLPDSIFLLEEPGGGLSAPQERLASWVEGAREGARVVWTRTRFARPPRRFPAPAALYATSGLRLLAEFEDGAVFGVEPGIPPSSNPFHEAYEFLRTREPDAESDFELFFDRGSRSAAKGPILFYRRAPCRKEALRHRFFLHVYPEAPGVLPAERVRYRFDNLDFHFLTLGVLLEGAGTGGGACLAMIRLPNYEIALVRTGQYRVGGGEVFWSAEIRPE